MKKCRQNYTRSFKRLNVDRSWKTKENTREARAIKGIASLSHMYMRHESVRVVWKAKQEITMDFSI